MSANPRDECKPSLCLVAHFAYGEMAHVDTGHIGGVEHQTSLTARWFAKRGYPVSMLTWDEGQPDEIEIDGVRIIKMCAHNAGTPGLRFLAPRWTSLNRAMRRANADLYYHNCGEYVTGQVALWCALHGRKFVYSVANDPDCDQRLPEMKKLRERVLYRYGLRHADRIIVQTKRQQEMLRQGFGLDSVVIPMPCPGPGEDEYQPPSKPVSGSIRVVWIGRIDRQKRPEWLLDVAEAMPDVAFDIVGTPNRQDNYTRDVLERAKMMLNVTVHGRVSRERMRAFYRNAGCLLCTSVFEGFPNTFLEAWSYGLPIVSTFDPDGLIAGRGLGLTATDVWGLVGGLKTLLESSNNWREASENARRYYSENHTVDVVLLQFERVFLDALR